MAMAIIAMIAPASQLTAAATVPAAAQLIDENASENVAMRDEV
jgi:hypothetical protein